MAKALGVEILWKAKQMYEERWTEEEVKAHPAVRLHVGQRKWSQMQIAAHLGISETSVLRAIHNLGRFANRNNMPLPTTKTDDELKLAAAESLKKLQAMIAAEKAELTPGETRADGMLKELTPDAIAAHLLSHLKRPEDG